MATAHMKTYEEYLEWCPPPEARRRAIMDKYVVTAEEVKFVAEQIASLNDPEAEHVIEDQLCHKIIAMAANGHDVKEQAHEMNLMLLKDTTRWYT